MSKEIVISNSSTTRFMEVDERFYCLWNEDFVRLFHDTAFKIISELSDVVAEYTDEDWNHWDLADANFCLDDYLL